MHLRLFSVCFFFYQGCLDLVSGWISEAIKRSFKVLGFNQLGSLSLCYTNSEFTHDSIFVHLEH